jgi:hypothetical protein
MTAAAHCPQIQQHPGGEEKVLSAAGKAVDPYWVTYGQHIDANVLQILESYRIGNIVHDAGASTTTNAASPYANDPKRNPALLQRTSNPFNGETPEHVLVQRLAREEVPFALTFSVASSLRTTCFSCAIIFQCR